MSCNNTSNESQTLSTEDKEHILLTMSGTGFIAAAVCLVALVMLCVFKLYRFPVHRLAMYQVMAALFFSLVCILELINYPDDHNPFTNISNVICPATGFLMEYSLWVKLLFTLCLTFHLFAYSIFYKDFKRFEIAHVIISIFFPLLFVWIPFVTSDYGKAGASWCWITPWNNNSDPFNKSTNGLVEEYVLLYGPAMLSLTLAVIAVMVIISVLVYRAYCRNTSDIDENTPLFIGDNKHKKILKEVLPLVVYPILSFLLYIPAFVNRIFGTLCLVPGPGVFYASAVSLPLLGLFAGLTLIIHITVLKCSRLRTSTKQVQNRTNNHQSIRSIDDDFINTTATTTVYYDTTKESEFDSEYNIMIQYLL